MFSKTIFVAAAALFMGVANAANPGCLLGAVNEYDTPSDIKAVCSSKDITKQVQAKCGDKTEDALAALADICNDAGVKVSTKLPSTASGTASPTGTSDSKSSGSASSTGAASPSSGSSSGNTENAATSGSATTSSGAPESTGDASALEISVAALLAGFGVVVAAL